MGPPDGFEVWSKYEDVAMHFNQLLISFRVQALGGLAALATLAGYVVDKTQTVADRRATVRAMSAAFFCLWGGVATLDLWYYRRLLLGAVEALRVYERARPSVQLTVTIDHIVGAGEKAPFAFYGAGALPLIVAFVWSFCGPRGSSPSAALPTAGEPNAAATVPTTPS